MDLPDLSILSRFHSDSSSFIASAVHENTGLPMDGNCSVFGLEPVREKHGGNPVASFQTRFRMALTLGIMPACSSRVRSLCGIRHHPIGLLQLCFAGLKRRIPQPETIFMHPRAVVCLVMAPGSFECIPVHGVCSITNVAQRQLRLFDRIDIDLPALSTDRRTR